MMEHNKMEKSGVIRMGVDRQGRGLAGLAPTRSGASPVAAMHESCVGPHPAPTCTAGAGETGTASAKNPRTIKAEEEGRKHGTSMDHEKEVVGIDESMKFVKSRREEHREDMDTAENGKEDLDPNSNGRRSGEHNSRDMLERW